MRHGIYNSAIPHSANPGRLAATARWAVFACRCAITISVLVLPAGATDWSGPAQQLAHKIAAATGPGAVTITVENRSSLSRKDFDAIGSALRADLEALGVRQANPEQAAASVAVVLSENPQAYVWVAEIHQGAGEPAVALVSFPREGAATFTRETTPVTVREIPLWTQEERILDVVVLEEDNAPKHIAVLGSDAVSLYRQQNGKWQPEQALAITHARPWPRDLRGRLLPARDHLLDVYLPGVYCRSTTGLPLTLNCRESDDPWPLVAVAPTAFPSFGGSPPAAVQMGAFYAATRNFFTGALTPGAGKLSTVPKFYSAAPLPREKYVLWLFAATDGQVHMVDGVTDQVARLRWGSDLAGLKSSCGTGWQVLATGAANGGLDLVQAFEVLDRDPVLVSAAADFPGEVTALWTEPKGDSAIAVVRDRETGNYEAFRLAISCSQ